ncbi:hypothetical protein SLEP1_g47456 [Rubroshorea leprosula]|uniref:Uncharacterized protein n=1 Tax=Rubroshorea leprosula TaxID=152421 RepID=A0AAV5LQI4_9ROSI|nr:hypothetical protein SLEP1_g47456 [Rubroshorea leprosula]
MMDLMNVGNDIQEFLRRSCNVPDDKDEEELMDELDALEARFLQHLQDMLHQPADPTLGGWVCSKLSANTFCEEDENCVNGNIHANVEGSTSN